MPDLRPPTASNWPSFRMHIAALTSVVVHPRRTFAQSAMLWRDLVNGALVVDTPDPQTRWPVLLRTSIQLDGDTLTIVERRWLAAGGAAEFDRLAQAHAAQIMARTDPLETLRRIQIATWYLAGCIASAWSTIAIAWRHDLAWLGVNALATAAPLLLRWTAQRLLRFVVHRDRGWLARAFHALDETDVQHLQRRRATRIARAVPSNISLR
jgi:hypothetical protein